MHIVDRRGKALCPDDALVSRVHEFDRDREIRAGDLDRTGQAIAHAEQPTDLGHRGIRRAQPKRRSARRHEQPAQPRQLGDELIGQSLRNGCVRPRVADEAEWQDGD